MVVDVVRTMCFLFTRLRANCETDLDGCIGCLACKLQDRSRRLCVQGVRQNEMVQILIPTESLIHQAVAARCLTLPPPLLT